MRPLVRYPYPNLVKGDIVLFSFDRELKSCLWINQLALEWKIVKAIIATTLGSFNYINKNFLTVDDPVPRYHLCDSLHLPTVSSIQVTWRDDMYCVDAQGALIAVFE